MIITRGQLHRWGDERIAKAVPEGGLTPLQLAAADISTADRLWVLLREDIIPSRDLRLLACDWAQVACREAGWQDARSMRAITVARRFAVGTATEAERAAAANAAHAAWAQAVCAVRAADFAAWAQAAWAQAADFAATAWPEAKTKARAEKAAAKAAWSTSFEAVGAAVWSAKSEASVTATDARSSHLDDVVKVLRRQGGGE